MEGAVAVKCDLMVKYIAKKKSRNCSVIFYEDCIMCVQPVVWELPMSLCAVKLVEL